MSIARVAIFLFWIVLLASCADLGTQPHDGLTLRTLAQSYRMSDTLQLTVNNSGSSICKILSRNQNLSFYIEIAERGVWKDRDTVNFGPEVAIYGPIWLKPGQARLNTLPLANISVSPKGQCRIRTEYMPADQQGWKSLYSNVFKLDE